jgi:hypothetical protein
VARAASREAARRAAGLRRSGGRVRELAQGDGVVIGGSVPEVGQYQPPGRSGCRLGQRGQGQPVDLRGERAVPAQPAAVLSAAPATGGTSRPAKPGQEGTQGRGRPWPRSREPGRGAEQVDGEVGGERDRRLELVVDGSLGRGRGDRRGHGRDRGSSGAGVPVGSGAQPVDAQRGRPPSQVCAVGAGAPGGDAPLDAAAPGTARHTDGRDPARIDPEHTDGQPDGEPPGEVCGAEELRLARGRRAGAEQAGTAGRPHSRHVGPRGLRRLDHHVPPSREVVAAAGEGTAGKEKSRDDGPRGAAPGPLRAGRVTEPLPDPLRPVDDPHPRPVTCRHPAAKGQFSPVVRGR